MNINYEHFYFFQANALSKMKAVTELLQLMEKVLSMVLVLLVIMLALEKKKLTSKCFMIGLFCFVSRESSCLLPTNQSLDDLLYVHSTTKTCKEFMCNSERRSTFACNNIHQTL